MIALDKCRVRPIGICEVPRRIISKAILYILREDIQDVAGSSQLCAGQVAGLEAAVHAMNSVFEDVETEAVLLVDASNAFNSLNRQNALLNIRLLCPAISTILINTYRESSDLFLGGDTLLSQEGTTQGDPLAMSTYALSTRPLIDALKCDNSTKQIWYADDATAAGSSSALKQWWQRLLEIGPSFGYYANASKTWLVTKERYMSLAQESFKDTEVNITTEGRPLLGAAIGKISFVSEYVTQKVQTWVKELERLSSIAESQPHAAYASLTHGLSS